MTVQTETTKIGITGVAGRMGQMLLRTCLADAGITFVGGTEPAGSRHSGKDPAALTGLAGSTSTDTTGPTGSVITDDADALFKAADVIVDFTSPAAADRHVALARKHGTAWVLGTTGLSDDQNTCVAAQAKNSAVLQAANFSVGVSLLLNLVKQAAAALPPELWDIDILEMHHNQKLDAPSGTALALGKAAADGRGVTFDQVSKRSREGVTGVRPTGEIGFATLRGGDVAGDHQVIFAATQERIEIGHRATDRAIFARGAIHAAKWLAGKPAGHYSMHDVLGL